MLGAVLVSVYGLCAMTMVCAHERAKECSRKLRPSAVALESLLCSQKPHLRLFDGLLEGWYLMEVWCGAVWRSVLWCGVVWCGVVLCCIASCCVVWCGLVCSGVVLWCVVLCGVVWCGVVLCGVVGCGVVWGGVV